MKIGEQHEESFVDHRAGTHVQPGDACADFGQHNIQPEHNNPRPEHNALDVFAEHQQP
jgi:hypothetical protein